MSNLLISNPRLDIGQNGYGEGWEKERCLTPICCLERNPIAKAKEDKYLPEIGTLVATKINEDQDTDSFFVAEKHISVRRSGDGVYLGHVPGAGGDVWWVKHEDDTIGAYSYTEVFDRD
jgi:hypothetical protein